MTQHNKHIEITNVVKHRYGGLYSILYEGTSTEDLSQHIVYLHLFPFEQKVWIRPIEEWTDDRFTIISREEAEAIMALDRGQYMTLIREAKLASQS